tara:strand:+ start:9673 stop:12696 length:3024 start_codon:yes stop_codon:yes gene_type:complete
MKFVNMIALLIGIIILIIAIFFAPNQQVIEQYTDDKLTAKYVNDKIHGSDGGKQIVLTDRKTDGVIGNSAVPKQCTLVKAWFLEQIEEGSDVYKLSDQSTILSLGRTDDLDCIDNSVASIAKFLKEREVGKRDVVRYDNEADLYLEQTLQYDHKYKDGLDRKYFAYYIGESDEETINRTFDIDYEFDKKMASPIEFFMPPNNLQKMIALNFKKTIGMGSNYCKYPASDQVDSQKKVRLVNLQFERHYKKVGEELFSIVYREKAGGRRVVEMNEITSFPVFRQKFCATECSKAIDKPDMWIKANDSKSFGRVNFVDLINNPTKQVCERVNINGKEINSSEDLIVQEKDIDKSRYAYNKDSDRYDISYTYNSEDFYYLKADPKFEIPMTKCELGKSFETVPPTKKDMNAIDWIYVTDRTCKDVDPCTDVLEHDLGFKFNSQDSKAGEMVMLTPVEIAPVDQFTKCIGIDLVYHVTTTTVDGNLPFKIDPILTILKKGKEAVCKISIEGKDMSLQISENTDKVQFAPFDIFENDQFVFNLQTGNYGVKIVKLSIVLKCQRFEQIKEAATLLKDNVCEYPSYDKCKVDAYYKKDFDSGQYSCEDYASGENCSEDNIKYSYKDIECDNKSTKFKSKDINIDEENRLVNTSLNLNMSLENCMALCDERHGCYGVNLDKVSHSCVFYGSETAKIVIKCTPTEDFLIEIFHSDDKRHQVPGEYEPPKAINCVGNWSQWSACSKPCGEGIKTRTWKTTTEPKNGGIACPSPSEETLSCKVKDCPPDAIDCEGSWSGWSDCSKEGTQTRTWKTSTPPLHGGKPCPSPSTETESCKINCEGSWSEWSDCSKSCGEGTQTRTWTTSIEPLNGGTSCPSPLTESKSCKIKDCPKPAVKIPSKFFQVGDRRRPRAGYSTEVLKAADRFKWPWATREQLLEGFRELGVETIVESFTDSDNKFNQTVIFETPVNIKYIKINGKPIQLDLYDFNNKIQKSYDATSLSKYRQMPNIFIIDDVYAE